MSSVIEKIAVLERKYSKFQQFQCNLNTLSVWIEAQFGVELFPKKANNNATRRHADIDNKDNPFFEMEVLRQRVGQLEARVSQLEGCIPEGQRRSQIAVSLQAGTHKSAQICNAAKAKAAARKSHGEGNGTKKMKKRKRTSDEYEEIEIKKEKLDDVEDEIDDDEYANQDQMDMDDVEMMNHNDIKEEIDEDGNVTNKSIKFTTRGRRHVVPRRFAEYASSSDLPALMKQSNTNSNNTPPKKVRIKIGPTKKYPQKIKRPSHAVDVASGVSLIGNKDAIDALIDRISLIEPPEDDNMIVLHEKHPDVKVDKNQLITVINKSGGMCFRLTRKITTLVFEDSVLASASPFGTKFYQNSLPSDPMESIVDFILDSGFEETFAKKNVYTIIAQVCNEARAGRVRKMAGMGTSSFSNVMANMNSGFVSYNEAADSPTVTIAPSTRTTTTAVNENVTTSTIPVPVETNSTIINESGVSAATAESNMQTLEEALESAINEFCVDDISTLPLSSEPAINNNNDTADEAESIAE